MSMLISIFIRWRSTKRRRHELPHSQLAERLISKVGCGQMNPSELREHAQDLIEARFSSKAMDMIASLGAHGTSPANVERDLHTWLKNLHNVCLEPKLLKMIVQKPDEKKPTSIDLPILPFHEVLHAISNAGEMQFELSLVGPGGEDAVAKFWQWAVTQPWVKSTPLLRTSIT